MSDGIPGEQLPAETTTQTGEVSSEQKAVENKPGTTVEDIQWLIAFVTLQWNEVCQRDNRFSDIGPPPWLTR